MSPVETLPPDQRAVLQLVLQQGRSYEDLAKLLGISPDAVRARAHTALESLGPDAGPRLPAERRGEIVDYLLGQQSDPEREATHQRLAGSASARAWARVLSGELAPMARAELPEIPEPELEPEPEPVRTRPRTVGSNGSGATEASAGAGATGTTPARRAISADAADGATTELDPAVEEDAADPSGPGVSRLGGALLLGGVAILLIALIFFLVNRGGSDSSSTSAGTPPPTSQPASGASQSTPGQTGTGPQVVPVASAALAAPGGGKTPSGAAQLVVQGNGANFLIAAQGLPPVKGDSYAVWLYNSASDAKPLAFFKAENIKAGRAGGAAPVPQDFKRFQNVIISRQPVTSAKKPPSRPGTIVLQGKLVYAAPKK